MEMTGYVYDSKLWITKDGINGSKEIYLSSMPYIGRVILDNASIGRIVEGCTQYMKGAVVYTKCSKDSKYVGGEIVPDAIYDGIDNGIIIKKCQTAVFDMGQNITAIPYIKMKGEAGERVTIRFDEVLNDGSEVTENYISGIHNASGPKGTILEIGQQDGAMLRL